MEWLMMRGKSRGGRAEERVYEAETESEEREREREKEGCSERNRKRTK